MLLHPQCLEVLLVSLVPLELLASAREQLEQQQLEQLEQQQVELRLLLEEALKQE